MNCLQTHKSTNRTLLPLNDKQYIILFGVYAPTLQADPAEIERFYTNLHSLPTNFPANDKIVSLGNFNARACYAVTWKGVLGQDRIGNCKNNGHLLLDFCAEQQLSIMNTLPPPKKQLESYLDALSVQMAGTCLIIYLYDSRT